MPPRGVLELLSVAIEFRDNTPATPHDQQVLPALFEEVKAKLQERFGEKFEKSKRVRSHFLFLIESPSKTKLLTFFSITVR